MSCSVRSSLEKSSDCSYPSVAESAMRAVVGYALAGPELHAAKEILFGNQTAKHSTLLASTYLYEIDSTVTGTRGDELGINAKIATVVMAGGRLGTMITPIGIVTFASLGMAPFAIASATAYGASLVAHGLGSYYLTSVYCKAVMRSNQSV